MSEQAAPGRGGDNFARRKLLGIFAAPWLTQACYALTQLGIPELLASGPRTVTELADLTGARPFQLGRMLRALRLAGILGAAGPDRYELNATSQLLRRGVPDSVYDNAIMQGDQVYRAFAEFLHTIQTGQPAFAYVYGRTFYEYLQDNPEAAATFDNSMGDQGAPATLAACTVPDQGRVVDIGGGNGTLLAQVLAERPGLHGALVELPAAAATASAYLSGLDPAIASRIEVQAGDFFTEELPAAADVYLICRVLHNWTDPRALDLLARVHAAARPDSRLIVMEQLLPEADEPVPGGASAGMVDLLMLVTQEGGDRTRAEYIDLLTKAGFEVLAVHPGAGAQPGAIEARPI
jgi:hypothetical protein